MLAAYGNSNKHLAAALRLAQQAGDTDFIEANKSSVKAAKVPSQWRMYFKAYLRLESERKDYHGHIPWTAVKDWAVHYRYSEDQTELLMEVVDFVDNAVLEKRLKDTENGNARKSRQEAKQARRPPRR